MNPPDVRPSQPLHETGPTTMRTRTQERDQMWSQIGWIGQSGYMYSLNEKPSQYERGSISPLWILVDNERRDIDEDVDKSSAR